jgi:hypothetical protein
MIIDSEGIGPEVESILTYLGAERYLSLPMH